MTATPLPALDAPRPGGELGRWTVSLLLVVGLHAAGFLALLTWRAPIELVEPPPPAVMIDMAPAPTPPAPPQLALPLPEPPPPPVIQPPPRFEPPPVQEPPPPVLAKPEVALPPPPPPPPPKPVPRRVEKPPPPRPVPQPPLAAAPPVEAPPVAAPPVAAPPVAAPPAAAPAAAPVAVPSTPPTYQGILIAQLDRHKRYPRAAEMRGEQGTPTLRFTLARSGKVLAYKLDRSSGSKLLDQEALAMIQRADPLPPFPPEMAQAEQEFTVPVNFKLR